jgi:general secretion pathway protein A
VIDEAHKLTPSVFEEVRLLSNLELPGEKLLQIVLAGQDELLEMLGRPELRQISQRISIRLSLAPLAAGDIEQYIALRWSKVGGTMPPPFAADVYPEIARWSRGIPRLVNAICDNAITGAFVEKPPVVSLRHVWEAVRDLGLMPAGTVALRNSKPATPVAPPAPAMTAAVKGEGPLCVPVAPKRVAKAGTVPEPERRSWFVKLGLGT